MPQVEAFHRCAAAMHDRAARHHEEAAELFDAMGLSEMASGEREHVRLEHQGAARERERARLSGELIASRAK